MLTVRRIDFSSGPENTNRQITITFNDGNEPNAEQKHLFEIANGSQDQLTEALITLSRVVRQQITAAE